MDRSIRVDTEGVVRCAVRRAGLVQDDGFTRGTTVYELNGDRAPVLIDLGTGWNAASGGARSLIPGAVEHARHVRGLLRPAAYTRVDYKGFVWEFSGGEFTASPEVIAAGAEELRRECEERDAFWRNSSRSNSQATAAGDES